MTNTAYSVLEDIFTNQINVLNIAVRTKAEDVESAKSICQKNNYDVQLVREDRYEDLQVYNKQEDKLRPLHNSDVITGSTPLLEVLEILSEKEYIFVKVKRNITHIVTRADLDSIPVRIWLYGMISLFEQDLKKAIDLSGIQWQKFLEECRLEEAKKRYKQKKRNNEETNLLDCLQLADVKTIVKQFWGVFSKYFPDNLSKIININFNKIIQLRNDLAHGQKLQKDWNLIYYLISIITFTLKRIEIEIP